MIAELAGAQRGVVARRQLLERGMDRRAVDRRLAAGQLVPLHRGVYAVGHRALPLGWRAWAAVLAAGDDAVLAHRSAGVWWGMLGGWSGAVHVMLPRQTGRSPASGRREGLVVHRVPGLLESDVTVHEGLRCTTPARTLADIAASAPRLLGRALREAEVLRLDVGPIQDLLEDEPRRRGARALRTALGTMAVGGADARSPLEHDVLDLLERSGLPPAQANVMVAGHLVDLLWPGQRIVAEVDGRAVHDTAAAFEADRRRDNDLQLAGYLVLRFTHRRMRDDAAGVVAEVRAALAGHPRKAF